MKRIAILLAATPLSTMVATVLFLLSFSSVYAQHAILGNVNPNIRTTQISDIQTTDPYLLQFSLTCIETASGEQLVLTPEKDSGFQLSKRKLYKSKTFKYKGETQTLFLLRDHSYKDSLFFYIYYEHKATKENPLEPIYLVQIKDDPLLLPLADDPERGYISPLRTALLNNPIAADPKVRAYFESMEPTPSSFEKRDMLARTSHASHFPQFKWGVLFGVSYGQFRPKEIDLNRQISFVPGVFADIPLVSCLSYHPELTFEKFSSEGKVLHGNEKNNFANYSMTSILSPQVIRVTHLYVPGQILPYAEGGVLLAFKAQKTLEYDYYGTELDRIDGPINYGQSLGQLKKIQHFEGTLSVPAFSFGFLIGIGAEWQYSRNHSAYLTGRMIYEPGKYERIHFGLQVAFNL